MTTALPALPHATLRTVSLREESQSIHVHLPGCVGRNIFHFRRSKDPLFYESSTYIVPDYPREVSDSQLEIAFAVTLPSSVTLVSGVVDYFIPQSTLLSLGLELSPVLAELSGAYIIGMSAYKPTDLPITASLWSQIGVQVTVPSVLLGLIGIILLIG